MLDWALLEVSSLHAPACLREGAQSHRELREESAELGRVCDLSWLRGGCRVVPRSSRAQGNFSATPAHYSGPAGNCSYKHRTLHWGQEAAPATSCVALGKTLVISGCKSHLQHEGIGSAPHSHTWGLWEKSRGRAAYSKSWSFQETAERTSVLHQLRLPWPITLDISLLWVGIRTAHCAHRCCFMLTRSSYWVLHVSLINKNEKISWLLFNKCLEVNDVYKIPGISLAL